jgi:transcriptional regulator
LEALNNLREEIASNVDFLKFELNSLLENLCPLFTDREYKVRESSIDLLKQLILNEYIQSNNSLQSFFHLINVHLSCAMTHIIEHIQYSSLKLLDILIENKPDFIQAYALKILQNFIDQISKASLKGNKRVLKNEPGKFSSTLNWRKNVLNRLNKMLTIVANRDLSNGDASGGQITVPVSFNESRQCVVVLEKDQSHNLQKATLTLRLA